MTEQKEDTEESEVICIADIEKFDALPAWRQEAVLAGILAARSDEARKKNSESRKKWWETDKADELRERWKTPASKKRRKMAYGSEEAYRLEQQRKSKTRWADESQHRAQSERMLGNRHQIGRRKEED